MTRNYVLGDPHSKPEKEIYKEAAKELLLPFPATPIGGMPKLNKITGGLRLREFSIICGATGVGKTTLIANLSASLLVDGVSHFVASVETGSTDFLKRVISVIQDEDWNTGDAVPINKLKEFHVEKGHIFQKEKLHLSLYDSRFSVETLMSDIAWMVENKGCKVAFIDNLNFFMEITNAANQIIEMDRVIHELVIFCKKIDVHVVMVMHPKKTDSGRVENEFDIKGSSTAVQEAHNIFLFNRPAKECIEQGFATVMDRELKICKMRRKGRAVGARLILKSAQGVKYEEGDLLQWT